MSWRVHQRAFLDNAGNAKQEEVKAGGTTFRRTLSRAYNALGQMEALKDASQNATSFRYDLGAMSTLDALLSSRVVSLAQTACAGSERVVALPKLWFGPSHGCSYCSSARFSATADEYASVYEYIQPGGKGCNPAGPGDAWFYWVARASAS